MSDSLAVRAAKTSSSDSTVLDPASLESSRRSSSLTLVRQVLDTFAARDAAGEVLTAVRTYPARPAQWAAYPEWIHPDLQAAYNAKGIQQLYTHQAAAAEA